MTQLATLDAIDRKIDKQAAGAVTISPTKGLVVESLGQAMELAKLMAISNTAVPKHLRGDPGACLAIAIQGYEWGINPFALANKSYCVNDRLAYESALYHAVVQRRAPIKGRIKMDYAGKDGTRTCRVWAVLDDESEDVVEFTSPEKSKIKPQNSPLWTSDPDQQLFYSAVRGFARRHFPDVMMGIYTVDELIDSADAVPGAKLPEPVKGSAGLVAKLTQRPVSAGQTLHNPETGELLQEGETLPAQEQDHAAAADTAQSTPTESDVAGADAQLPTDTAPFKEPGAMSDNEKWWVSLRELAGDLPEANLMAGVGHWRKSHNLMAMKEHLAKPKDQKGLFDAIEKREGVYFSVAQ